MIPIILISSKDRKTEIFLSDYIQKEKIHKDYIFRVIPQKKELGIGEVRSILKMLVVSPPHPRLFIFHAFDRSTIESQNALLKTLEENTESNHFIMISQSEHFILSTIRSRSRLVHLERDATPQLQNPLSAYLSKSEQNPTLELLTKKEFMPDGPEEAVQTVDWVISYFRGRLSEQGLPSAQILEHALQLRLWLLSNNLNPQLVIDNLLIFIYKTFSMKK